MEKKFAELRVSNVYWFNAEREALVKLVLVRQSFNIDTTRASYGWAEADGDREKVVTVTTFDPQNPDVLPCFYKSPEDFEKGKTIGKEELYWMRDEGGLCGVLLKEQHNRRARMDDKGCYIWAFVKGQAVKWYFNEHINTVTLHCVAGDTNAKATADEEVPESYFSVEEVYKYNDWTEVREDGESVKHEGVYNRLFLEPDQNALLDKLQAVLDECKKAGIHVYFDLCHYKLRAFNEKPIERVEYDPILEDGEEALDLDLSRAARSIRGVYDLNTEDTSLKMVIKK